MELERTNDKCICQCLRKGCNNKVAMDNNEAIICTDSKCQRYISSISSEYINVEEIAKDYFNDIQTYLDLGGEKDKIVRQDFIMNREHKKRLIKCAFNKTIIEKRVNYKKRVFDMKEDIKKFEKECMEKNKKRRVNVDERKEDDEMLT